MAGPRVSVLLPAYRETPEMLRASVGSILAQTFRDFELVIVGDGVPDPESTRVLEESARGDARVRLFLEPHRGLVPALNFGLGKCSGELLARHDADDWSEPGRLARQAGELDRRRDLVALGSAVVRHREDGARLWTSRYPRTPREVRETLPRECPFCQGAVLMRREAVERIGGYRPGLTNVEDYDFFWRLLELGSGANLREPLYHYRFTRKSMSTEGPAEQVLLAHAVRRLASMRREGGPEDLEQAIRDASEALGRSSFRYQSLFWPGDHLLLAGRNREALQVYLRGIGRTPWRPTGWLKLVRWLLFIPLPPVRKLMFEGLPSALAPLFRPASRVPVAASK